MRRAIRALRRQPLMTAFAILSLGAGIGANTAVFGVLNALLLRPLAVESPDRLVSIAAIQPSAPDFSEDRLPPEAYRRFAAESGLFESALAWQGDYPLVNLEAGGAHFASPLARVGGAYFATAGVRPYLGSFFGEGERSDVAVLDYRTWRRRYNADRNVLGKMIRINDRPFTIIGVTPPSFTGLELEVAPEVTIPMEIDAQAHVAMTARLRPGVSAARAESRLAALWTDPLRRIQVRSMSTGASFLRVRQTPSVRILLALAGGVLLVAIANLTSLFLARAARQKREYAIRVALGAGRWSLVRSLLIESSMIAAGSAVVGVVIAWRAGSWLVDRLWTGVTNTAINPTPDWRVLAFAAAISTVPALLLALVPAGGLFRVGPAGALRSHGRGFSAGSGGVGRLLVATQAACALMLICGALLLSRSLHGLRYADLGFRRDGILMVGLFPRGPIPDRTGYYRELSQRLLQLPGVTDVTFSVAGPLAANEIRRPISLPGRSEVAAQSVVEYAGPRFFGTLGVRLLEGREFTWLDRESSPPVAVIGASLAKRLFGGADAIGRAIECDRIRRTIVGVVADACLGNPHSRAPFAAYFPLMQDASYNGFWIDIRGANPNSLGIPARQTLEAMGRHTALRIQTLAEHADTVFVKERLVAEVGSFLAGIAVLLAAIGIYAVASQDVTRRTRELGIRMALGAQRRSVVGMVLGDILKLIVAGASVGIPLTLWSSRLLTSLLFGVSPRDPLMIATALGVLLALSLAAGWAPALRASRIDPVLSIRVE